MKKYFFLLVLPMIGFSQTNKILTTKDSLSYYIDKMKVEDVDLKFEIVKLMRVSYIYLDGSVLTKKQIDRKREEILVQLKKGKPFNELANQYTMDGNKNGDLGWFEEGMMVKDFETAIKAHKKGDIFTVNIPENKWYYVVLKTFEDIEKVKITTQSK